MSAPWAPHSVLALPHTEQGRESKYWGISDIAVLISTTKDKFSGAFGAEIWGWLYELFFRRREEKEWEAQPRLMWI